MGHRRWALRRVKNEIMVSRRLLFLSAVLLAVISIQEARRESITQRVKGPSEGDVDHGSLSRQKRKFVIETKKEQVTKHDDDDEKEDNESKDSTIKALKHIAEEIEDVEEKEEKEEKKKKNHQESVHLLADALSDAVAENQKRKFVIETKKEQVTKHDDDD